MGGGWDLESEVTTGLIPSSTLLAILIVSIGQIVMITIIMNVIVIIINRAPPMPPTPYINLLKSLIYFCFFGLCRPFLFVYGIPEAREVFKNLPEARGSVLAKYEPVASHGDPFQAPKP